MKSQTAVHFASKSTLVPASLWRAITGFIVWASAFLVLYIGHALGCLHLPLVLHADGLRATLVALWLIHVFIAILLWLQSHRRLKQVIPARQSLAHAYFMWRVSRLLDGSAFGAVIVIGLPLLAFPVCSG